MKLLFRLLLAAGLVTRTPATPPVEPAPTGSLLLKLSNPTNAAIARMYGAGTLLPPVSSFYINLTSPANATISRARGAGTIVAAVGGAEGKLWSDPATWGGSIPLSTDNVTIGSTVSVILDIPNAVCASLEVQGTLTALKDRNTGITTGYINVGGSGSYIAGTEAAPLPSAFSHTITLNGAEVGRAVRTVQGATLGFTNNGVGRSFQVQPGGVLSLIGTAPSVKRTKLNANVAGGINTFTLADSTGWKANDEIVIGTTDFYGVSVPEKLTLQANASGTTVQTTSTIASPRWGVMQYVTDAGMSQSPGTLTAPPVGTPTTVDERAFVVNLTRNIVVQGANDSAWASNKFGAHCMFMGRTSRIKLDGVQFRRVGQAGALGRYPIHWHMMSYNMPNGFSQPSDGTFLGAVSGNYAKNCSISESGQRMMTIHGTHGVTLDSNVGFDIVGHAIFLEDGAEQDNTITNNVVLKVRAPTAANKLLNHDTAAGPDYSGRGTNGTTGSSGIWNTNPKNTFSGNWLNDTAGPGFWGSFTTQCFGLSVNVPLKPINIPITLIENTVAMGCAGVGQMTNDIVVNEKGDLSQSAYEASFFSLPIRGLQLYKNSAGGYSNRISEGQYLGWVCADNAGMDVFGQATVDTSVMRNTLVVAESLNNATSKRLSSLRAAFATYHELLNFKDILAVGYKYIAGTKTSDGDIYVGGGIFRMWDLYLQPIFSFSENTGWKMIDCDIPFKTLPPFKDGGVDGNRHWQIAGVIYDKNGLFKNQGKYWVNNDPFFTYSASGLVDAIPGTPSNGKITPDHYFGVQGFKHSGDLSQYTFQSAINVSRQDSSGVEVGNWNVPDGATSWMLGNMRSFAAHQGGRYKLTFPAFAPGNYAEFSNIFMKGASDRFLIGVQFDCSLTPKVYQAAGGFDILPDNRFNPAGTHVAAQIASGMGRYLTAVGTMAEVVADTTGTKFFKDVANNLVWLQVNTNAMSSLPGAYYGDNPFTLEYRPVVTAITI